MGGLLSLMGILSSKGYRGEGDRGAGFAIPAIRCWILERSVPTAGFSATRAVWLASGYSTQVDMVCERRREYLSRAHLGGMDLNELYMEDRLDAPHFQRVLVSLNRMVMR